MRGSGEPNAAGRMGRRHFLKASTAGALAASGFTAGCGGGGGGGAPVPPDGRSVSETARSAILDALVDLAPSLLETDLASAQAQAVAFLEAKPEIDHAGTTQGGVFGVFLDGVVTHLILTRPPGTGSAGRAATTRGTELPSGGGTALLLNAMGPGYRDETALIAPSLREKDYTVRTEPATIEALSVLDQPSVFYLSAHGDEVAVPVIQNNQFVLDSQKRIVMESAFGISTSTPYNDATRERYTPQILLGEVAAGVVQEDTVGGRAVFAKRLIVTTRWVRRRWTFASNSLIWISACSSNSAKSRDFAEACLAGAKGKALYVGWSDLTEDDHAADVSAFVVDRLLGANLLAPAESPKQRPFDFVQIYADLRRRGLHARPTLDPATTRPFSNRTTEIIFTQGTASQFGLLAPTIERVLLDEYQSKAILLGTFGAPAASERSVLVGGVAAAVAEGDWTPNRIECTIPRSGAGSSGDVVVVVRGHRSNVRRITEWAFAFDYHYDDDREPLKVEGPLAVRFRADIGSYRKEPGKPPVQTVRTAIATGDSGGTLVASGTLVEAGCTTTWSGSLPIRPPYAPSQSNLILGAWMEIDPVQRTGIIGLQFGMRSFSAFKVRTVCPPDLDVTVDLLPPALDASLTHEFSDPLETTSDKAMLTALPVTLDAFMGVAAGSYVSSELGMRWQWKAVVAKSIPDPGAARRPAIR